MSNWRHNGVCSSFQQRDNNIAKVIFTAYSTDFHYMNPLTPPALPPPQSAPCWMRGNYVTGPVVWRWGTGQVACRIPWHELRNLCATDNEQRRCLALPSPRQDAQIEHAAQLARATLVSCRGSLNCKRQQTSDAYQIMPWIFISLLLIFTSFDSLLVCMSYFLRGARKCGSLFGYNVPNFNTSRGCNSDTQKIPNLHSAITTSC